MRFPIRLHQTTLLKLFVPALLIACTNLSHAKDPAKEVNASTIPIATANPISSPMGLMELWNEARANNPQLIQMREAYLAAKAVGPQLAAPNNPQVGLVWTNTPTNSPLALGTAASGSYTLTQSFPFPGKKSLAAAAADDTAESMSAQNDNAVLQLASQLANAYYTALAAQKQLMALKESVLRLEIIKNVTKARYANNAAAYTEYLNTQVAQSSAQADQFSMERQLQVAIKTINTLIGRDPRESLLLSEEPMFQKLSAPTLIELETQAETNHPLLRGSQLQLESARKQLKLAKMAYLPDFQIIGTSFTQRGALADSNPSTGYQFEFDIVVPLFFFMKERYGVEQAARNQSALEMNDIGLKQQVILSVDSAYASYEQSRSQVLFLRDRQIPEANAAYKVALSAYTNNGQGYSDLLVAQNQLKALQVQLAIADSSLAQNHAALLAAAGNDPIGH